MQRLMIWLGVFTLLVSTASAQVTVVADVRAAIGRNDLAGAAAIVETFRTARGDTPDALEALSWVGRGALAAGDNQAATKYAQETQKLAAAMLATRSLDADKHLPVALGAAIETEAKAMAATGQRSQCGAVSPGTDESLPGDINPRPPPEKHPSLEPGGPAGAAAPSQGASGRADAGHEGPAGSAVLLGALVPGLQGRGADHRADPGRLQRPGPRHYRPDPRYGYATAGVDATPAQELAHIDVVRQQYYGMIADMAVPVSDEDALGYGMDATPTIVLVDRQGKVALYHPGGMTREELEPHLKKIVAAP